MGKYKAVVFDLDGTLLDTLEDIGSTANEVLVERGFPTHEMDAYRTFIGDGIKMLMSRALPEDSREEELIDACEAEFIERYQTTWNRTSKPYQGIPELLDELVSRNYKITVLSNKPHDFTLKYVSDLLENWQFEVVFGKREGVPKKPDPQGAVEIAKLIECPADECIYLGDTGTDMETARRAEMYAVGVLWGFRGKEELEAGGALATIKRPDELLELLE